MLLSPGEFTLQEIINLTLCFDFESESQKEVNHVDVESGCHQGQCQPPLGSVSLSQ